jgi:hypothetical protein
MNTTGADSVLIRNLSLGTRARNCLRRAEITTAAELVTWTEYELLRDVHGLGPTALAEITDALAERGWALRKRARPVVSWGACPECGRDIGLRADKRLSRHRVTPGGGAWCAGSHRTRPPGTSPLNLTPTGPQGPGSAPGALAISGRCSSLVRARASARRPARPPAVSGVTP